MWGHGTLFVLSTSTQVGFVLSKSIILCSITDIKGRPIGDED